MTYSLLVKDEKTGVLGGAATTGSLCVGGWVLRGDSRFGLSASQGSAPSTLWGEDVIEAMRGGMSAPEAVRHVVEADGGRDHRQLAAIDPAGGTGAFSGGQSVPSYGDLCADGMVAAGNLLTNDAVLPALRDGFRAARGALGARLIAALRAGAAAGGDSRGLRSAALLIVGNDMPPLTLRIDMSDDPIAALEALYEASQSEPYVGWLDYCPTRAAPERHEP